MADLNDPQFWDERSDYRTVVADFTASYSQRAWELADLPPGASVVDIAAGTGALTRFAAQAGNETLAVDFSEAMVSAIGDLDLDGVEALVMDGQNLSLRDDRFDAAFSMFGIMLFEDWEKGLSEMVRVLKRGGKACVGTWKSRDGAGPNLLVAGLVREAFPDLALKDAAPGMTAWSRPGGFEFALRKAGLKDVALHEVTTQFVIDADMLSRPEQLFQFSPVWLDLDEERRAAILERIGNLAARNQGKIVVDSPAILGFGTKRRSVPG